MTLKLTRHSCSDKTPHILLVISGRELSSAESSGFLDSCPSNCEILLFTGPGPKASEVVQFAKEISGSCAEQKVKRVSVLGIGAGGSIAIALCDLFPKLVRRLVLLDTCTRLEPSAVAELIDRMEMFFPLGLPLRSLGEDFDARPLLHRLHCPSLILSSPEANAYERNQTELIAGRVPNAWLKRLQDVPLQAEGRVSTELMELVEAFLDVAAKRPQKNKHRSKAA